MNKQPPQIARPTFRKSLRRTSMISVVITMTIVWFVLSVTSMLTLKQYAQSNLKLSGASISQNLEAAMVFKDLPAAHETLTALGNLGQYSQAILLNQHGQELTRWERSATINNSLVANWVRHWLYPTPIRQTIWHNGKPLGELLLTGTGDIITHFVWISFALLTGCLLLVACASLAITNRLNRGLVDALQNITDVVHDVRANRNFGRRVQPERIAEFHLFGQDFNSLLTEMEAWQHQLQTKNASLRKSAMRDPLTGLKNRSSFDSDLQAVLTDPAQKAQSALLFMDSDNFKQINDTWGHAAGDRVLVEIANRLLSFDGTVNSAYRLGGDEFAMLLHGVHAHDDLQKLIQQLRQNIAHPIPFRDGHYITVSLSIGYALPDANSTPESLMELADQRMYFEKKRRHNHAF